MMRIEVIHVTVMTISLAISSPTVQSHSHLVRRNQSQVLGKFHLKHLKPTIETY